MNMPWDPSARDKGGGGGLDMSSQVEVLPSVYELIALSLRCK